MENHIPQKNVIRQKSELPWLDKNAKRAMRTKHQAEGTDQYMVAAANCRRILMESRNKYLDKIQDNLAELRRGSKKWWRLTEQIMNRQANPSFFPALKDTGGNWCVTPKQKAEAFARCWSAKFVMLPEVEEQFFSEPD